ncbi:MAG: SdpI family protein [archaeon]|jgi:uncharacterized membrane protein
MATKKSKSAKEIKSVKKTVKLENKKLDKSILFSIAFVISAVALSILFYNSLPQIITTHWGINGEANGFMDKTTGLTLVPLLMIIIGLVLYFIPKLDPLKENILDFRKDYNKFIAVIMGFMLYIHAITLGINLGLNINIGQVLSPAFAALIYFTGSMISKAKRNYFIGIRTPWTLSNDKVWASTHTIGGKLFKGAGILCLTGLLFPDFAFFFILAPIIIASIWAIVYSYKEYAALKK